MPDIHSVPVYPVEHKGRPTTPGAYPNVPYPATVPLFPPTTSAVEFSPGHQLTRPLGGGAQSAAADCRVQFRIMSSQKPMCQPQARLRLRNASPARGANLGTAWKFTSHGSAVLSWHDQLAPCPMQFVKLCSRPSARDRFSSLSNGFVAIIHTRGHASRACCPSATDRAHLSTATGGFSLSPPAGRGLGRGAQIRWQTRAGAASRRDGLLSPPLSSRGGEGDQIVGWRQC